MGGPLVQKVLQIARWWQQNIKESLGAFWTVGPIGLHRSHIHEVSPGERRKVTGRVVTFLGRYYILDTEQDIHNPCYLPNNSERNITNISEMYYQHLRKSLRKGYLHKHMQVGCLCELRGRERRDQKSLPKYLELELFGLLSVSSFNKPRCQNGLMTIVATLDWGSK